eukprot:UN08583
MEFNIITHLLSIMKCLCNNNNNNNNTSTTSKVQGLTVYPSVLKQAIENPLLLSSPRFIICSKTQTNIELYEIFVQTLLILNTKHQQQQQEEENNTTMMMMMNDEVTLLPSTTSSSEPILLLTNPLRSE